MNLKLTWLIVAVTCLLVTILSGASLAAMTSTNYAIPTDVIASGGGTSTSAGYSNRGVIGQGSPVGAHATGGGIYLAFSGFLYTTSPAIDDPDGDNVIALLDNCPNDPNPTQADANNNGIGDTCDAGSDSDGDFLSDANEVLAGTDPLIPDTDGDGTLDGLDVAPAITNASFAWAPGVQSQTASNGTTNYWLGLGLQTNQGTIGTMAITVTGPNGFSTTLTDADIDPTFPTATSLTLGKTFTLLDPGAYAFTVTDSTGLALNQVDLQVAALVVPRVDATTVNYQRQGDGSYRFLWAPVNDSSRTWYYRLRIYDQLSGQMVYSGPREMDASEVVPAGRLTDGVIYEYQIETQESPAWDTVFHKGSTDRVAFVPQFADHDPLGVIVSYVVAANLKASDGSWLTYLNFNVNDESALISASVTGPNTFSYTFNLATDVSYDVAKAFDPAVAGPGLYTFSFATASASYTYKTYLTSQVDYQLPDPTTQQVEDLGNGSVRFSWAPVEQPQPLWYRVRIYDQATGSYYQTGRLDAARTDINLGDIQAAIGTGTWEWVVLIHDSANWDTTRNRPAGPRVAYAPIAFDPIRPTVTPFVEHRIDGLGNDLIGYWASVVDVNNNLDSLRVVGPTGSGIDFDLLQDGTFYQEMNETGYYLNQPGLPVPGLYTFTATYNTNQTMLRYDYQSPPVSYDPIDFTNFNVDVQADDSYRFSWAPVPTDVPMWYKIQLYTPVDTNGDGHIDQIDASGYEPMTSAVFDPITVPTIFRVRARDSRSSTLHNNRTHSIYVGLEAPGFDYSTLADLDSDGWASNIDPDDTDPAVTPMAAPLAISYPNGGETFTSGALETITWTAPAGADHYRLHYFDADGTAHLIANVGNVTSYDWTVPTVPALESGKKVRVTAFDAGNANLGVDFSDSGFSIQPGAASPFAVTYPNGGQTLTSGTPETITWTAKTDADHYRLHYFDADGTAHLIANVGNVTSYGWTVPSVPSLETGKKVRVTAFDVGNANLGVDFSDSGFNIQPGGTPLAITYPNGGETFTGGAIAAITWIAPAGADHFRLHYFDADGTPHLVANVRNGTSYNWTVPNVVSLESSKKMRVSSFDAGNILLGVDYSDATFSIAPGADPLTLTYPNGGETLTGGTIAAITWTAPAGASYYRLHYFDADGAPHLVANVRNGTSYNWTVPDVVALETGKKMRISSFDASNTLLGVDYADATFEIQPGGTPLAVTYPNGGQTLTSGTMETITWTAPTAADHFRLHYFDADGTAHLIANVGNVTSYDWTVPTVVALESGKSIRITAFDAASNLLSVDYSDGIFAIDVP